ncbi:CNP1-like family protein [Noviherbaspirillum galbum]|uniref:CNP1-like uncharacterized domain-containing protein n=1 Tax=Noviherbaspirillum galbum TaxID=2709383 RepID=A0A6B3SZ75_9BURK|nr:CNP1-like family protein [Noviherbaspirillum galbum]NEX64422.1 hypothetical protein [Noviherbaspirillum galbum]
MIDRLPAAASAMALFILALAASAASSGAAAQSSRFEEDFDDQNRPWQEIAVQLPGPPQDRQLLPFYVSPTATQKFAVDAESISVGQDGVVRYTIVVTSEGGARNVSYEGIRCATYERKFYAFGRPDGGWSRSRRDQWEKIDGHAVNRQQDALFRDYFCDSKTVAGSAKDMLERLRYQRTLSPQRGQ